MSAQNRSASATGAARRARRAAAVLAGAGASAVLALSAGGAMASAAHAAVQVNCQATPSACGFPDATNTGVPATVTLKSVPSQVSSGPGWSYSASTDTVNVTGNGAVLSGLSIAGTVDITASNVTLNDDQVVTSGSYGIELRNTADDTVENSVVSGTDTTTGRVDYAIDDIFSNSTGLVIKDNNISECRIGITAAQGQLTGNYIHNFGYISGDHTDGIYDPEGTGQLTISDNTVLVNLSQTTAIMLEDASGQLLSNKTITGNLLAGGGYVIYAGGGYSDSANIVIQNNRFGQGFYALSGEYGAETQYYAAGSGNSWSGNVWDSTGATIPAP
jgi:Right handed beta helix region